MRDYIDTIPKTNIHRATADLRISLVILVLKTRRECSIFKSSYDLGYYSQSMTLVLNGNILTVMVQC